MASDPEEILGDHPPGHAAQTFQQLWEEAFSRTPIAARLERDVDHVAVLVNGAPEIVLLTPNVHEDFIQVPPQLDSTLSKSERRLAHRFSTRLTLRHQFR